MASSKPTDDLKGDPSNGGENDEREPIDEALLTMRNFRAEETRALLLEKGGQPARGAEKTLHGLVQTILDRCERDPEVMGLLIRLLGKLDILASYESHEGQLCDRKLRELRAVLIGATMATEGNEGAGHDQVQPRKHAADARRFLDLVEERIGKKGDDGTTTLKMRSNGKFWGLLSA